MAVFRVEDCATSRAPGRLLRRLDKVMSGVVEARFGGVDLSYQQWVALKVVGDDLVGNAGELARELGITTGATTRMVDVLETRGLMARERGSEDRRVVRLSLTAAGAATVQALQGRVVGAWNEALAGFEQAEAELLVGTLTRLLAAVERLATDMHGTGGDGTGAAVDDGRVPEEVGR